MKLKRNKDYDIDDERRCVYANDFFGNGYIIKKTSAKFIGPLSLIPSLLILCAGAIAILLIIKPFTILALSLWVFVGWRFVDEMVYYALSRLPYFRAD